MKAFDFIKWNALKSLGETTVRRRLTLAMALLMAVSISVFLVFLYSSQRRAIVAGMDARLETAARMAEALLPVHYHGGITGPSSVSDQEYQTIVDRHNRLCRSLDLEYLWSVMFWEGKVVFTTATSPDKEVQNRKHAGFLQVHSNPELYTTALTRRIKVFQNSRDRWGNLRMALIPYQDQKGRTYLMAAGMPLSEANQALNNLLDECLWGGLLLYIISIAGVYGLAGTLAHPLEKLAKTIEAIASGDVKRKAVEDNQYELALLARRFNQFNQALQDRIAELTRQGKEIRTILQSIENGVIVVDANRRVSHLNPAAERMTGWAMAEALDKPFEDVFQIINAQSRQPMDDPVAPVLKTGRAVKSSEHTTLVAHDKTERQIAASAAPLRNENDHIDGVVIAFSDISREYAMREAAREVEARFRGFYELGLIGMWVTTPDKKFNMFNDRVCEILGYSRQDLLNKSWADITHPEDLAANKQLFERTLAGELAGYSLDKRFVRGNGQIVHTSMSVRCVRKPDGSPAYFAGMIQDISDRKHNEQVLSDSLREKEALLKEVHHRVKNNLQIISSLLRLQSAHIDHPIAREALRDMRNRIRTMALLHENLYRSKNLAQVNLAPYFQNICTQLLRSMVPQAGLVNMEIKVAPVALEASQAVPCGLLLNELVSNCLKHAFPPGRPGRICVELQPLPGNQALRLRVSDNGVGLAPGFDPRNVCSLGLQLVTDLTRQLQGELKVESNGGAVFEVVFTPSGGYRIITINE